MKGSCPAAPLGLRATILGADVAYLRVVAQFFGGGRRCGFGEDYQSVSWRGRLPRLAISVRRGKKVKRLPSTSPMRLPAGGGAAAALVGRHRRHVPLLIAKQTAERTHVFSTEVHGSPHKNEGVLG